MIITRIIRKIRRTLWPVPVPFFTTDIYRFHIENRGWSVGRFSYGAPIVIWGDKSQIHIGAFCSFAEPCFVILSNHNQSHPSTYPFYNISSKGPIQPHPNPDLHQTTNGDVVFGNDVWVGRDATILSGVSVGHGAIIGASSVVTKDVPPYAIVAGNPARIVKYRFTPEQIDKLLALEWWNYPEDHIFMCKKLFVGHVDDFISKFDSFPDTFEDTVEMDLG